MFAAERLISSFELPSTICSRPTSAGRYDWYATSKKTVQMPVAKPTAYSCQIVRTPSQYATGTETSAAARPRSPEDQDRAPPQPIDPDAGRKREEQERQELDGREQPRPEGALLEREDRDERQRQQADLRPELADRLGAPEGQEVAVPPETAGPPHRHAETAAARVISMSPLTVFAASRASLPLDPSDGVSLTSSSELTSPLVELASIRRRVPGRTPMRTSPETDWTLISPSRIEPIALVARDGLRAQVGVRVVDREVARDECRRGRAGDRAEPDVAGDGLKSCLAVDGRGTDVPAGRLDAERRDVLDGDVARCRLQLHVAEPAGGGDIGGGGRALEVGVFGAPDADADRGRATEGDPGRADTEALAADADLDGDLVAVQLDGRPLDRLAGGVVFAESLEHDGGAAGLARVDRDQAGGVLDAKARLVGRVKRLHGGTP